MKSRRSVKELLDKVIYYVPVVVLERITVPKWMEKKCQQNNYKSENEEPKCKRFKTKKEEVEVKKMVLSKNKNVNRTKLKCSNKDKLKNLCNKAQINSEFKNIPNKKKDVKKRVKRVSEKMIKKSKLKNSSSVSKIKIRDVHTIKDNIDLINKEIMLFRTKKSDASEINNNIPLIFPHFETNHFTLQYFKQLHKKYFNNYVQDTIVIISNVIFMNLLTNIHCISRVNRVLQWKDKHKMTQNIQSQTILCIKYVSVLDNFLKKNIIDIISNFEDSDYEHAFLMLMLSLFASLKMFGSDVFKNSSVILKKLERLQWESAVEHDKFDHNKVQLTFESDVFCSWYHDLSTLIGEGSYTDPNVVKWWQLICSPAVFKTAYFRAAVEAITNGADVEKVVCLIDKAANDVRLYSHLKNGKNSSKYKKGKLEKLIELVNGSARVNTINDEIIQPYTSGFDALNPIDQSMISIQSDHTITSSYTRTKTSKSSGLNTPSEIFPETYSTDTPITPIPYHINDYQVENTSTTVQAELFQKFEHINYEDMYVPHIAVHTRITKPLDSNVFYENCSDTHLTYNIPATPTPFVQVHPVRNISITQLNSIPLIHTYLHKKFNSTIQIGDVEHRVNRKLFHQMVSIPTEASIKFISSTPLSYKTDFNENCLNDTAMERNMSQPYE